MKLVDFTPTHIPLLIALYLPLYAPAPYQLQGMPTKRESKLILSSVFAGGVLGYMFFLLQYNKQVKAFSAIRDSTAEYLNTANLIVKSLVAEKKTDQSYNDLLRAIRFVSIEKNIEKAKEKLVPVAPKSAL